MKKDSLLLKIAGGFFHFTVNYTFILHNKIKVFIKI